MQRPHLSSEHLKLTSGCVLCPQLKGLSLQGHLHHIPALKMKASDTSHDTKQPHLSQSAILLAGKLRGDFFHQSQDGT